MNTHTLSKALTELFSLLHAYKLKNISRMNSVLDRKESAAEHTWSALVLADYLMSAHDFGVDKSKVFQLLLYHDLVEIETGDVDVLDKKKRVGKEQRERVAAKTLAKKLPAALGKKYTSLFAEYLERRTREAQFANAIDVLDAQLHEIDYKQDWKGWTEARLRTLKEHCFTSFPELKTLFNELLVWLRRHGYFGVRTN